MGAVRSMLYGKKAPLELWEKLYCVQLTSLIEKFQVIDVTPSELWNGWKPDVSYFRIFGTPALVHVPDETRNKLDLKAVECILEGTVHIQNSLECGTRKIIVSRDVVFKEDAFY